MGNKKGLPGLAVVAGLVGILGIAGLTMNVASLTNADLTNRAARDLSESVLQDNNTFSREKALKFLQSIGYQGNLAESQSVYLRPVVDGFWSNKVEVVIAPKMTPDNGVVREGNVLFDAYGGSPVGQIIASFTRDDLKEKGYSVN